jgi:TadE-like protein
MYERLILGHRGQALAETAIMLPLVLLALFAVIYFCNLGIVSERVQLTTRYGALNLFAQNSGPAYSASDIYNQTVSTQVCPQPPSTLLYNGAPLPAPTSAPFWNPASVDTDTCSLTTKDLGGASFLMARYLTAGDVQISATASASLIPAWFLTKITGGGAGQVNESMSWVHSAWPGAVIACAAKTQQEVEDLLTATETITLPGGWNPGSCNIQH